VKKKANPQKEIIIKFCELDKDGKATIRKKKRFTIDIPIVAMDDNLCNLIQLSF